MRRRGRIGSSPRHATRKKSDQQKKQQAVAPPDLFALGRRARLRRLCVCVSPSLFIYVCVCLSMRRPCGASTAVSLSLSSSPSADPATCITNQSIHPALLAADRRNNSAWNQRWFVVATHELAKCKVGDGRVSCRGCVCISCVYADRPSLTRPDSQRKLHAQTRTGDQEAGSAVAAAIGAREVAFTLQHIAADMGNESPWHYLRGYGLCVCFFRSIFPAWLWWACVCVKPLMKPSRPLKRKHFQALAARGLRRGAPGDPGPQDPAAGDGGACVCWLNMYVDIVWCVLAHVC